MSRIHTRSLTPRTDSPYKEYTEIQSYWKQAYLCTFADFKKSIDSVECESFINIQDKLGTATKTHTDSSNRHSQKLCPKWKSWMKTRKVSKLKQKWTMWWALSTNIHNNTRQCDHNKEKSTKGKCGMLFPCG